MINIRDPYWMADNSGQLDVTEKILDALELDSVYLPHGQYLTAALIELTEARRLIGDGATYNDNGRGTVLICGGSGIKVMGTGRFVGVENMKIKGPGNTTETTGLRVGEEIYGANCFHGLNLHIEGFGIGFDNYGVDNSRLVGGALYSNGINGRTNSNDFLRVDSVASSGALDCGWHITGAGGGANFSTLVSTNNPCHFRLEPGARVKLNAVWIEATTGELACVDMKTNARLYCDLVHRMKGTETIPFAVMEGGGFLKFKNCDGSPELDFVAPFSANIYGEGEAGLKNGSAYTAGSY